MRIQYLRPGLVLVSLFVLTLLACTEKAPVDELVPEAGLLSWVPADTPYVFANTRPFPPEALDKFLADADRSIDLYRKLLSRSLEDAAALSPEEARLFEIMVAFVEELDGRLSRAGLAELGLEPEGLMVMYGDPLLPAGRNEIADEAKLWSFVERMEQRLAANASRGQFGPVSYIRVDMGPLRLIMGSKDNELRWALVAAERESESLPKLFGDERPADSLADSGEFADIQTLHDFPGYGSGYLDLMRLSDALASSADDLPGQGAAYGSACADFLHGLLQGVPRVVFGTTEANAQLYRTRVIAETSSSVGQVLSQIAYPVAGVGQATDAIFAMGVGIDVPQLRGGLRSLMRFVAATGAGCEWIDAQAVEQSLPSMEMALGPMTAMFKGVYLELSDLRLDAESQAPSELKARVLAEVDDPRGLFAFAGMLSPELARLDVPTDGSPVTVPAAYLPPGSPPLRVGIKNKSLALAAGEGGDASVRDLLASTPLSPAPMFSLTYNFERLGDLIRASTDQVAMAAAARNGRPVEELRAEVNAMADLYAAYSVMSMSVWADEKGLVIDQEMRFR